MNKEVQVEKSMSSDERRLDSLKIQKGRKPGSRAEQGMVSLKLYGESARTIERLQAEANEDGPRRVQLRDIVSLSLSRISSEDLRQLRREKVTVKDQFEERLREYQRSYPGSTANEFKSHLLELYRKQANNH